MFDALFGYVGKKIKFVALASFVLGCIASFIGAIAMICIENLGLFFLLLIGGPIISWLSAFVLYGFGEFIDTTMYNNIILSSIEHITSENKGYFATISTNTTDIKRAANTQNAATTQTKPATSQRPKPTYAQSTSSTPVYNYANVKSYFDFLFGDIGGKIKAVALLSFCLGCIASFIGMIALLVSEAALMALLVLICGPIAAWLSSLTLYGFGELIETTTSNKALLASIENHLLDSKKLLATTSTTTLEIKHSLIAKKVATNHPQPVTVTPEPAVEQPQTEQPVETKPVVKAQATKSEDIDKEKLYIYGVQMFERRSYQVAYNIFLKIPDYKNVQEYLEKLKQLI